MEPKAPNTGASLCTNAWAVISLDTGQTRPNPATTGAQLAHTARSGFHGAESASNRADSPCIAGPVDNDCGPDEHRGVNGYSLILLWPIIGWLLGSIPAFVIGQRLGVIHPGEAFIPIVGPYIVLLHSIKRSGWLCILGLIPFVSFFFYIWLICVIPVDHGRTRWWILAFLIPLVNVIAYYVYAFTLEPYSGQSAWT
jgi:hypothetical protein